MTLAEFLYPIRARPKGDQVVAALFFIKEANPVFSSVSPAKLKSDLANAQIPRANSANYSSVLARLVPKVHRVDSGEWEITETGEKYVRQMLDLPAEAVEPIPAEEDVDALSKLSSSLETEAVRDYVDEAIKCLKAGARRAAVVFLWSGAVYTLREEIWEAQTPSAIDAALKAHNPKTRAFKLKSDFANVPDVTLLQIAQDFELIEKNDKTMLGQALDLRNTCGHPVKYLPGEKKVSSFIEDVLQIVLELRLTECIQ